MFVVHRECFEWAGSRVVIETGKVARQADGAVMVSIGETMVLATVVSNREQQESGVGYLPLTVQYQEKSFAVGRIPGGYFKREGRPSENEILVSRLIDRPIRPLFPQWYSVETQIVATVLSYDMKNSPDIVAMIASFAAAEIAGLPLADTLGAARVGYINGSYILNPTLEQQASSKLDLVVAGTENGILMVESEVEELSEDLVLGAVMFGYEGYKPVLSAICSLSEKCSKKEFSAPETDLIGLESEIRSMAEEEFQRIFKSPTSKQERNIALATLRSGVDDALVSGDSGQSWDPREISSVFKKVQSDVMRANLLEHGIRVDGRDLNDVRPISSEVGILPRAHGSSLFTRGETQALVAVTLGATEDEQSIDSLDGMTRRHFILHYNFPPYSVGEVGRLGSPGRREIGHGKLAWRAIRPLLPARELFPYTLRIVSEITESNGSSSMATVCGASLALMDAGVNLGSPVAGIAMGLVCKDDRHVVITDILGDEDSLGDMDFKVAGTSNGITALQMDIKIQGVSEIVMRDALMKARCAIDKVLVEMSGSISDSRSSLGAFTPRVKNMTVPTGKIRSLIGTGGRVIREITEKTGAKIDIKDDGSVTVFASNPGKMDEVVKWIRSITDEPEVGGVYDGVVVKCMEFGAFVNFFGSKDGLVHISELADGRVAKVCDVVKEGDRVRVKFVGFDRNGKVRLSMKNVSQDPDELDEADVARVI